MATMRFLDLKLSKNIEEKCTALSSKYGENYFWTGLRPCSGVLINRIFELSGYKLASLYT